VAGRQFWLGPALAGAVVTFWADTDVIHLSIAGVRVKSLRSHLSVNDPGLPVLQRRPQRRPVTGPRTAAG
jgi:hypothetical protein